MCGLIIQVRDDDVIEKTAACRCRDDNDCDNKLTKYAHVLRKLRV